MQKILKNKKTALFIIITIIIAITSLFLSIAKGSVDISIQEMINILLNKGNINNSHKFIIINLRIPRTISVIMVGMSLSLCGAIFQTLFKNPLTEPYLLGISSGAALGVSIASIFNLFIFVSGIWSTFIFAFIFSLLSALLIFSLAGKNRTSLLVILLSGLAINFFTSSLNSLLLYFNRDKIQNIIFWQMGSFSLSSYEKIIFTSPIMIVLIVILLSKSKQLDVLLLSDDTATSIGLNVNKERLTILILTTLLTSICVGISGTIGFIGLIIPHIVKLLFPLRHKIILPISLYLGAVFTLICDVISRVIVPNTEIPIGIITALFGAPFFIYILQRTKRGLL